MPQFAAHPANGYAFLLPVVRRLSRLLFLVVPMVDEQTRKFAANGLATLIGSLPVSDPDAALELIFSHTPEIPLWPQLPGNPREGMLNQFSEGIPGIREDHERIWIDQGSGDFAGETLSFYERYLAALESPEELAASPFAVSRERAPGLFAFAEAMAGRPAAAVKGQMTGPFTLLTGLHDREGRAAYYDPAMRELVVKGLSLKAAWQVRFLAALNPRPILFLDEPALAGLGSSAFLTVSLAELKAELDEIIALAREAGGLVGVHVCANTDWDFLLGTSLDIVSFDAYGFFDRFAACRDAVYRFLDRGGIIAWGIVPTSDKEAIEKETAESLLARWEEQADLLATGSLWERKTLLARTLITPSCGTGALPLPLAEKVLALTRDLSGLLRAKYL